MAATATAVPMLKDTLGIQFLPIDDPRRGPYWNLFELWYHRAHEAHAPYLLGFEGDPTRVWYVTPETARLGAMGLLLEPEGVFAVPGRLAEYGHELGKLVNDQSLSDDDFVKAMAELNSDFMPFLDEMDTHHALHAKSHGATHRGEVVYCPGCNAAAASLLKAANGPEVVAHLHSLGPVRYREALYRLGFAEHVKTFKAELVTWLEKQPDRLLIDTKVLEGL